MDLFLDNKINQLVFFLALGAVYGMAISVFKNYPFLAPFLSLMIAFSAGVFTRNLSRGLQAALEFLIGTCIGAVVLGLMKLKGLPPGGAPAVGHLAYTALVVNLFLSMPSWVIGIPTGRFVRNKIW